MFRSSRSSSGVYLHKNLKLKVKNVNYFAYDRLRFEACRLEEQNDSLAAEPEGSRPLITKSATGQNPYTSHSNTFIVPRFTVYTAAKKPLIMRAAVLTVMLLLK
jgi:hypothetical protein